MKDDRLRCREHRSRVVSGDARAVTSRFPRSQRVIPNHGGSIQKIPLPRNDHTTLAELQQHCKKGICLLSSCSSVFKAACPDGGRRKPPDPHKSSDALLRSPVRSGPPPTLPSWSTFRLCSRRHRIVCELTEPSRWKTFDSICSVGMD